VLTVFVLALLVRSLVAGVVAVRFGGALFGDDLNYSSMAAAVADGSTGGWDQFTHDLYWRNATFLLPLTAVYQVLGSGSYLGQLLVALAGAGAAAAAARLSLELGSRGVALLSGGVVALLPSQVLFSALTLKDAFVWACLAALALLVALAGRVSRPRAALCGLGVITTLVALAFLRQHTLVVACWALAGAAWAGQARDRVIRGLAAVVLAVSVPLAVGAGPAGLTLVRDGAGSLEEQRALGAQGASTAVVAPAPSGGGGGEDPLAAGQSQAVAEVAAAQQQAEQAERALRAAQQQAEQAEKALRAAQEGQAGTVDGQAQRDAVEQRLTILAEQARAARQLLAERQAQVRELTAPAVAVPTRELDDGFAGASGSTSSNVRYLPRGLAVVVLYPLPWQDTANPRIAMAKAETLAWYPVLLLAVLGLALLRPRARVLLFPALVGAGTACMWALVEGNFGTAYRHRGEFVWAVALLAAAGAQLLVGRWSRRRPPERVIDLVLAEQTEPVRAAAQGLQPYPEPAVPVLVRSRAGRVEPPG
jgi:hypothetical protein